MSLINQLWHAMCDWVCDWMYGMFRHEAYTELLRPYAKTSAVDREDRREYERTRDMLDGIERELNRLARIAEGRHP